MSKFSALGQAMCNEGEAYCWMQECMPYPASPCNSNQELSCYSKENNVTCCSDPTVECQVMDDTCHWQCVDAVSNNTNDFCNGGMDMLMSGFATTKGTNTCIILFFRAWTLDSQFKFIVGCFGVAWLGFCIELLIAIRRQISG